MKWSGHTVRYFVKNSDFVADADIGYVISGNWAVFGLFSSK